MGINVEQLQDKMGQFNPAHRRIHFHKESPISYNPWAEAHLIWPPLSLSAALWTWQITYWSADVGANVFSAWAAAATACSSQPVLNPLDLQFSPPPPPSTPPSGSEWGPPACLLIPPCPCLSSKVWKGFTDECHLLRQEETCRWGQLRATWPDTAENKVNKKIQGQTNTSWAQIKRGKTGGGRDGANKKKI